MSKLKVVDTNRNDLAYDQKIYNAIKNATKSLDESIQERARLVEAMTRALDAGEPYPYDRLVLSLENLDSLIKKLKSNFQGLYRLRLQNMQFIAEKSSYN